MLADVQLAWGPWVFLTLAAALQIAVWVDETAQCKVQQVSLPNCSRYTLYSLACMTTHIVHRVTIPLLMSLSLTSLGKILWKLCAIVCALAFLDLKLPETHAQYGL